MPLGRAGGRGRKRPAGLGCVVKKKKGRLAGPCGRKKKKGVEEKEMGRAKREREGEKEMHPIAFEFEFEI
jgi:hypothetical protein